jgi:hypothetical protein
MDFLFFLFGGRSSPEGLWERTGDKFAGCVLRVVEMDGELVGKIAILPESMSRAGWHVGDLKWRNIKRVDSKQWQLQDLRMHYDTRKASVVMVDYREYKLTLGACGRLRLHTGGLPFFPEQRWKKFGVGS